MKQEGLVATGGEERRYICKNRQNSREHQTDSSIQADRYMECGTLWNPSGYATMGWAHKYGVYTTYVETALLEVVVFFIP